MSYDVTIGDESFNYTYNVSKLFYDHIPDMGNGGGLNEIHGKTGRAACDILNMAFRNIEKTRHNMWENGAIGEPYMCATYDAKNGWGSLVGALIFLALIMGACAENPRKKVGVH